MDADMVKEVVKGSRKYFDSCATLPVEFRINALKKLRTSIIIHESEINEALRKDLGKGAAESYMCETGMTLAEISYMIKNIRKLVSDKKVKTPLAQFHSVSYSKPSPRGSVLIISPWNYPFLLTMEPLVDAIAAGNTVVIKPSEYSPNTTAIMQTIISKCFDHEHVSVVTGGVKESQLLLKEKWGKIFFTGNKSVGKEVLRKAAENLTSVTLELGGKSPCIVDSSANIKLAARRIVFGKYLNCGQTCVAPDYVLCHSSVKDKFIKAVKMEIVRQFGENPLENTEYGKIISKRHFDRIVPLINQSKVIHGGSIDEDRLKIEPTVLDNVSLDDAVMKEEIFGPILPVLTFDKLGTVVDFVNSGNSPLALYIFSSNKRNIKMITDCCRFGGGCVNDTIIHLATSEMGFGGFGESGMGSYHGKEGFECFSHRKSIVNKKTWIDLPMRYQPYSDIKSKLVRMFLK